MTIDPVAPWFVVVTATLMGLGACVRAARSSPHRRGWWRRAGIVVLLGGIALRPGTERADAAVVTSDLDVFFVVDRTGSMVAEDHGGGPRLDAVRRDIVELRASLPGARWSLVGFDDEVTRLTPLITDATAFDAAADRLRPEVLAYSGGSSPRLVVAPLVVHLGAAAAQEPDRRRIVFLFTDGEVTADRPSHDSFEAVGELTDGGAVLGYGTDAGGRMRVWDTTGPTDDYIVDRLTGEDAVSVIDREVLGAIGAELDAPVIDRTAGEPVRGALEGFDVGAVRTTPGRVPIHQDRGWWAAYPLLVLVMWELAAVTTDVARVMPRRPARSVAP